MKCENNKHFKHSINDVQGNGLTSYLTNKTYHLLSSDKAVCVKSTRRIFIYANRISLKDTYNPSWQ